MYMREERIMVTGNKTMKHKIIKLLSRYILITNAVFLALMHLTVYCYQPNSLSQYEQIDLMNY